MAPLSAWERVLPLRPAVALGLCACGYSAPAPVQCAFLPAVLRGENLIGQAKSGSGKTVAYAAGLLHDLDLAFEHAHALLLPTKHPKDPQISVRQRLQSLVVVPTREIGIQVAAEITRIATPMCKAFEQPPGAAAAVCSGLCQPPATECSEPKPEADGASKEAASHIQVCTCAQTGAGITSSFAVLACVGGCPLTYDLMAMRLRRPQIVIVTPGRMLTLTQDDSSSTSKKARGSHGHVASVISAIRWRLPPLRNLVLDEADRLLSESFRPQLVSLAKLLVDIGKVRVLAYSATFPPPVLTFAEKLIYDLTTRPTKRGANAGVEEDSELRIVVDGVDPEPPAGFPAGSVLRKCFLVSSFFDQTCKSARIPLRMDVNQTVQKTLVDAPTINSITSFALTVNEETSEKDFIEHWTNILVPKDRVEFIQPPARDPSVQGPSSPTAHLEALAKWLDTDFDHWQDLRKKFLGSVMCLWKELKKGEQFVIFCNDLFSGLKVAQYLKALGLDSEYISGRIDQEVRNKHLRDFKARALRGLITSDLSARGIDIPEVDLIINVDLPDSHDTCLHRIGRCGRFGRSGGRVYFLVREKDELQTLKLFSMQTGLSIEFL